MSSASESPFELLSGRRFAFYPAIRSVEHNEWTLEQETWSEILVKNVETSQELWVPRNHLGEISSSDSPVLIVGLKRELELKAGQVMPYRGAVVSIPSPGPRPRAAEAEPEPEPPGSSSSTTEERTLNLVGRAIAIGIGACLLLALFLFQGIPNPIARFFQADTSTADQLYLGLTSRDNYLLVVAKLGQPDKEDWASKEEADLQFQTLWYPSRRYIVVLMGATRAEARYIGTLHDPTRKLLDSARLSGGGDTSSMMKNLPEF